jgi:hypothetical protein
MEMLQCPPVRVIHGSYENDIPITKAAEKAHEQTRKKISQKQGKIVTFEIDELVYAKVIDDVTKRRGTVAKYSSRPAKIVKILKLPSGDRSHKYDVLLEDGDLRLEEGVPVNMIKMRKVSRELLI